MDYLKELVDQDYQGHISLRFPDITANDDSNSVNIDPNNDEYYIVEEGHKIDFNSRAEIIEYLYQVGLI